MNNTHADRERDQEWSERQDRIAQYKEQAEVKHTPGVVRAAREIAAHLAVVNVAIAETRLCEIIARNTAAPELLEALKQFSECNLTEENCASFDVANKRIRNIARAAIAKAEGRAQ